jgi:multiple sugar transport system ATP-binding protein
MADIALDGVGKLYGAHRVIDDITLSIRPGEFVVLVGPSGCGKSTLLRMIAGLEEISEGEIRIDGRVVNDMRARERDLAMVFQSYALYPHMTVAENMSFALRLSGVPKAERTRRAADAARILGLETMLDRYPRDLSGGQRQRVAMGRAIVRDPRAFLFDEPLSNLDAKLRARMRGEIKALHARLGRTTIYVTHDQTEAMTMADRIVVLRAGRVEQTGAPLDLYEAPANAFVAGFLGTPEMNLIPGVAQGAGVRIDGGHVLPLPAALPLPDGKPVTWGGRPQHMGVGDGGLPARAEVVEPTGEAQEITARLGGVEIRAVLRGLPPVRVGDTLLLLPDRDRAMAFGPDGGRIGGRLS